jgi:PAS domain S-box-containing protein
LGEVTTATNTYINILKDKINEETYFNNKLAGTSPGMIYVLDLAEQKVIYSNKKATEILGYSQEAIESMSTTFTETLTHPEDLPYVNEHFKCFEDIKDDEICSFEHRLKDINGQYRWIRNYETVFKRNEAGKPVQIIGAAYDITEEKKIAQELKHREDQLVEAQALAQLGSFEWDMKKDTTTNSTQFYKIFEYTNRKQFDYFLSHVHPHDKEKLKACFENAFKTGNYECEFRYEINGKEKYIWSKGVVVFENGQPVKMTGTVQDITERRKIEETLLQKTIELEKRNTDLTEFTYVASHDLKEPLRKIATYADIILHKEQESFSAATQNHFQKIIESSKRMQKMIEDILALSSVAGSKDKEAYPLQSILEEALSLLEHTIQQKKATVNSDGLPQAPVIPSLFRQLFLNLIGNALKFSKKEVPPQITITHAYLNDRKVITATKDHACHLAIRVQDNGIGFSNESSEKIFSLFQRLHTRKEYEGNGLGLAICKRIAEEHAGTITASSEPGKGATFTVIIPC